MITTIQPLTTDICITPTTAWYICVANRIGKEHIAAFREGNYADASEDVQRKWCQVMLFFLPHVTCEYTGWSIKVRKGASECSTASDEALVMWMLQCYGSTWEEEAWEDASPKKRRIELIEMLDHSGNETDSSTVGSPKVQTAGSPKVPSAIEGKKRKGKHHSQNELGLFLDILRKITHNRSNKTATRTWEEALQREALKQDCKSKSKSNIENTESAYAGKMTVRKQKKQRFVMPYHDTTNEETPIPYRAASSTTDTYAV